MVRAGTSGLYTRPRRNLIERVFRSRLKGTLASCKRIPSTEAPIEARAIYPDAREFAAIEVAL